MKNSVNISLDLPSLAWVLLFIIECCVYASVVVEFYPWFRSHFPLFWGMVMLDNESETKRNKI